jgi:hypothetical protein
MSYPSLLTDRDVAARLAVSVAAVRRWRLVGRGPEFRKFGACVRYREEDLMAWIESQPLGGQKPSSIMGGLDDAAA